LEHRGFSSVELPVYAKGDDMRSRTLSRITAIALFASLTIPMRLSAQEQRRHDQEHRRYTVTDLGTLGGTLGAAQGINDRGWVVGFATLPGDQIQHSFLWADGIMTDLGTLGGPNSGGDQGGNFRPNLRGEVPGFAQTSDPSPLDVSCPFPGPVLICLPFIWKDGVKTQLPTLGGINGAATAINNRGEAMGGANNTTLDSTCPFKFQQFKPVIWKRGEIQELPTVSGDPDGQAFAINDKGQVVGMSTDCLGQITHALLWQKNGTVTDIGNLGGANGFNAAFAINHHGQIVGRSDLPGDTTAHGFLWEDGMMTDLGTLPGYFSSDVDAINDRGQIAGQSCDINFNCSVVLVENGVMTDLNTFIPAGSPLFLFGSGDINSHGQIVGAALQLSTGEVHAFLATPCDEDGADNEGCKTEVTAVAQGEASQSRKIALPESARQLIRQRLGSRYQFSGVGIPRN
jgi:probable HAF family extracellular repeat protein